MINFLSKFLYVLHGKKKKLIFMIFLFLFVSLLETLGVAMVGPFISLATDLKSIHENSFLKYIYAIGFFHSEHEFLIALGVFVVSVFYIKAFLSFNAQTYIFRFSFGQQGELRYRLMKLYLAAPYTFHLNRNSATIIQNILNETSTFANEIMIPLLTSVSNSVIVVALIALLVHTYALATVIIAFILILSIGLFQFFKDRLAKWGEEGHDAYIEMIRLVNHGLGGLKETRVIGCESYFSEQLEQQAKKFSHGASLAVSFSSLPRYVIEAFLITFLIIFTFLFISINQHSQNPQNLSAVLGIFALSSIRLLPAVSSLLSSMNSIRYKSYSLDKLYLDFKELETLHLPKEKISNQKRENMKMFSERVALDNVIYSYPGASKKSLTGISLEIKKGQSIGLIGKSGAGKTTLVDIILGLLIPLDGDILLDNVSIYKNLRGWQDMIGYVPQSIFLIDDTLERNIAFGVQDDQINHQQLYNAIEAAQLLELIEQLPNGLQTMVGERGVLLSGGQRQRVGIARALYHEREILVFDEATAALDNETEALVTESIKALSGIKTMIIIAHRLSTIEHCDTIYMMKDGQVVKSGSYQDVVLGNPTTS
jgi:ATP-binding cassette, subfamily B, bacterial PglK